MTKTFLVTIAALFASVVTATAQNMDAESTIPVILSSLPLVQLMGGEWYIHSTTNIKNY